jgi:hypothetical protein
MELNQHDYYKEDGRYVFTAHFHLKRGSCCGNKCRHCPYIPKYEKGNRQPADYLLENENLVVDTVTLTLEQLRPN